MCTELKLIIEVDGITHQNEKVYQNDIIRQRILESKGFTVIRFTDEEVLTDIHGVYGTLEQWIESFELSGKRLTMR